MRSISIPRLTVFSEAHILRNALFLFAITTLFYAVGAMLRLVQELSLFWPLNAVMAGIFARYVWLNRLHYYAICYGAMLLFDVVTTQWGMASLIINASNMVFIVIVAQLVMRDKHQAGSEPGPINALRLFYYCLIAAVFCALLGAIGSEGIDRQSFMPSLADWFSEQFSTGVLILPCVMTLTLPHEITRIHGKQLLPVLFLVLSVLAAIAVGGAGSLAFPLSALIWCAIRYPLPVTCALTLITGAAEIILVANSVINLAVSGPLQTAQLFSTRLGIATLAISPVIVSTSVAAINNLMRQVSLRADFDFLTRVYSRSGLYEALKKQPVNASQHMTVMLLDIDFFKSVNDNHGHECGDYVLTAFARQVREVVGEQGLVARMGGEEFVVAAKTLDPLDGYQLAENIRRRVESTVFHWRQQPLRTTVSIGIGSGTLDTRDTIDAFNELLVEADEYLYRAKKAGRNKTCAKSVAETDIRHEEASA
ncbi:GGDEF domain-containing protein [Scandinavium sp. V105_16]|uniref:diguanylate cyclase n=1 Tax=Scandinavium lactucae TaxID=3095028 RepID=A0AAJ2VWB3_9ENTR|nr:MULTISPECIES: GGDEF domain-containing protein [unclassified Scandinavium]MDX6022215.1 GGDEF domain-containing protein [Scandinavium sp. V105_16]MDX6033943.1 GGDEF domain-containing protein [Scandinavium sp. V105_12]MDX6042210.1 GGDEF domain-containing protein [Scandinavium sp. V105_6]MDX6052211.1 GGDEF domain-containing protein [Scandinavium sp. V105_1]